MTKRLRIGLLTHQWPGARMGGVGSYTWHCARALANAGHEAHVFTLPLPPDVRATVQRWTPTPFDPESAGGKLLLHEIDGVSERVAKGTLPALAGTAVMAAGEGVYRLAVGKFLGDAAQASALDVIETPEYEALGLPLLMRQKRRIPVITHIHSGSVIAHRMGMNVNRIEDIPQGLTPREELFEALECAAVYRADARCAATRTVVEWSVAGWWNENAIDHANELLRTTAIVRLPFVEENATSRPFSPPPKDGAVLYIGRLERLKGAHLLPEAINRLVEKCPEARVRITGPDTATAPSANNSSGGSMLAWMHKRLSPAAIDRVSLLGEQNRSQLERELVASRFLVLPSLADNYPYVCCEAMAAGRGVVLSDQIGATEVAGDAGVIFPRGNGVMCGETLARVWANDEQVQALAQTAWKRSRGELNVVNAIRARVIFYEEEIAAFERRGPSTPSETLPQRYERSVENALTKLDAALRGDLTSASTAGLPDIGDGFSPGGRLMEALRKLDGHHADQRLVLFGAGRHTQRLMAERSLWESAGYHAVEIIDEHERFANGGEFLGLSVRSVAAFEKELAEETTLRLANSDGPSFPIVVLSTDTFEQVFWERTATLRGLGVPVLRLYS